MKGAAEREEGEGKGRWVAGSGRALGGHDGSSAVKKVGQGKEGHVRERERKEGRRVRQKKKERNRRRREKKDDEKEEEVMWYVCSVVEWSGVEWREEDRSGEGGVQGEDGRQT